MKSGRLSGATLCHPVLRAPPADSCPGSQPSMDAPWGVCAEERPYRERQASLARPFAPSDRRLRLGAEVVRWSRLGDRRNIRPACSREAWSTGAEVAGAPWQTRRPPPRTGPDPDAWRSTGSDARFAAHRAPGRPRPNTSGSTAPKNLVAQDQVPLAAGRSRGRRGHSPGPPPRREPSRRAARPEHRLQPHRQLPNGGPRLSRLDRAAAPGAGGGPERHRELVDLARGTRGQASSTGRRRMRGPPGRRGGRRRSRGRG